ncbi:hypothetical protein B9Z55_017609 [Caenorhabditis nigoni]|uniref:7TM GPCR serpentine receptor class x (Srx) domain-containing protein n=1 Tax=Caenorhabditis nigoni TaxID=1611254 RepID=A0A2G5TAR3_9PELO|nr:hypothetical protein B9Z55_017609 [Caenorhabditis nigoni]
MVGISEEQKSKRRKKWQKMYIQSVIQDFIHLIDTTNYNYIYTLVDTELWMFIFSSLSHMSVFALDGAVMIYFHTDWNSCCIGKEDLKKSSVFVPGTHGCKVSAGIRNNTLLTSGLQVITHLSP